MSPQDLKSPSSASSKDEPKSSAVSGRGSVNPAMLQLSLQGSGQRAEQLEAKLQAQNLEIANFKEQLETQEDDIIRLKASETKSKRQVQSQQSQIATLQEELKKQEIQRSEFLEQLAPTLTRLEEFESENVSLTEQLQQMSDAHKQEI